MGKGQVPIGIISYGFNYLDSTALKDNALVMQGNQLRQGNNSSREYVKRGEAFVASLLTGTIKSGTNTFTLSAGFIFSNIKQVIDRVEIDFGKASGVLTLKPGQSKPFTVQGSGRLALGYTLYLKNGKKLSGYSSVEVVPVSVVKAIIPDVTYCDSVRIPSDKTYSLQYPGPDIIFIDPPRKGVADMLIYYSNCNNKQLTKPLIIFDGFDPGDTRKGKNIYGLINKDFGLGDKLRSKGFDIVIVNFPDGADFIVRNAYTAETVIKWVNNNKTTTNKLVVIGPSMGGLISRYALADLEKEGYNHQVGLWVSFDSPHQGANIAIGDQYFLDFFGRVVNNAGAQAGLDKLDSPAALQMLVDHHFKPSNVETPQCYFYRNLFLDEVKYNGLPGSNGYPQNLRKVALLNGSGVGTKQEGIDNTQYLLEMNVWKLIVRVAHGEVATSADLSFMRRSVFYGYCADEDNLPYYWERQNWSRPSTSQYFTTSYDKAPGGSTNTQNTLAEGGSGFTVHYPGHCFIPSVSALDLKTPYLGMDISTANIIANKLTPFDSYYAPPENQGHITFSAPSVNWIESELGTNWEISGPDIFCLSSNGLFNLSNIPQHASVVWSHSANLIPVSGQGTSSYTVKASSPSSSGSSWVKATVNNGWDIRVIQKSFVLGSPAPSISSKQIPSSGGPVEFRFTATVYNNASYTWYVNDVVQQGETGITFEWYFPCRITKTIKCKITNSCGTSAFSNSITKTGSCEKPLKYSVSPNPAKSTIAIELSSFDRKTSSITNEDNTFDWIRIYDLQGNLKKSLKYSKVNSTSINVNDLQEGTYIFEIGTDKITEKHQVIISR